MRPILMMLAVLLMCMSATCQRINSFYDTNLKARITIPQIRHWNINVAPSLEKGFSFDIIRYKNKSRKQDGYIVLNKKSSDSTNMFNVNNCYDSSLEKYFSKRKEIKYTINCHDEQVNRMEPLIRYRHIMFEYQHGTFNYKLDCSVNEKYFDELVPYFFEVAESVYFDD